MKPGRGKKRDYGIKGLAAHCLVVGEGGGWIPADNFIKLPSIIEIIVTFQTAFWTAKGKDTLHF